MGKQFIVVTDPLTQIDEIQVSLSGMVSTRRRIAGKRLVWEHHRRTWHIDDPHRGTKFATKERAEEVALYVANQYPHFRKRIVVRELKRTA